MKTTRMKTVCVLLLLICPYLYAADKPIDRHAVVARHCIVGSAPLVRVPLGNGEYCCTVDGTGLQTFGGNMLAHWAWHTAPLPPGFRQSDVPPTGTFQQGRNTGADTAIPKGFDPLYNWLRRNAHTANLGRVRLVRANGNAPGPDEIKSLKRELDLWTGLHRSRFTLDGVEVESRTAVGEADGAAFWVKSRLVAEGKLRIAIDFPYPMGEAKDWSGNFGAALNSAHTTTADVRRDDRYFKRTADDFVCTVNVLCRHGRVVETDLQRHLVFYGGDAGKDTLELKIDFFPQSEARPNDDADEFEETVAESVALWKDFWTTGGAIDLSGSTDPRWKELERRIVLSQYLMRSNSAGSWPSSESGLLTVDPWHGRFHMEMDWWHLAHYFLWGRERFADEALTCYERFKPTAVLLAQQLGYKGYKWGKSMEPNGRTSPWRGNQVLLWKQPHPIFFAELEYRARPNRETLEKWADIVEGTAIHMADYVKKDAKGVYHLDPVMPPSELGVTVDTVFDLAYWRYGLDAANRWRQLMGAPRNAEWDEIVAHLAPLPTIDDPQDGLVFVHSAEWRNSYVERNWEHPDLIGVYGMLPPLKGVDRETAKRTVSKVVRQWNWDKCWGWDFPWVAMAAARTGLPEKAVDMLLDDSPRNVYDDRGVNVGGPCPYLPGNGGLLYAIAMMAQGWDGAPKRDCPGFPANGKWKVRHEGLRSAP